MSSQKIEIKKTTLPFDKTLLSGLAALVLGMSGASCGPAAPGCSRINVRYAPQTSKGYVVDNAKSAQYATAGCPPGCTIIGETKDTYCCWCPD